MISKKDAMEFPFLKESSNLAKEIGLDMDLNEVFSDENTCMDIDEYLSETYHNRFYTHRPTEMFYESRVRFLGTCVVVNQIGKERAIHRFAEYEAAHFIQKVEHKSKEMFPIYFNMVFEEVFGRPNFICKTKDGMHYAVKVPDFLKFKRKIDKHKEYALVNQAVIGGYVIFKKETLLYLLQVGLEHLLYERIKNLFRDIPVRMDKVNDHKMSRFARGVVIPPLLLQLVKKFEYVDLHISIYKSPPDKHIENYDIEKLKEKVVKLKGTIPPCISWLMRKCNRGEHLPHFERFALMTFLLARQDSESEILSIFEKTSNYKKDEIDYLLSHTKKTGYKTPNCSKMDDNKICFRSSMCGGCVNPLQLLG